MITEEIEELDVQVRLVGGESIIDSVEELYKIEEIIKEQLENFERKYNYGTFDTDNSLLLERKIKKDKILPHEKDDKIIQLIKPLMEQQSEGLKKQIEMYNNKNLKPPPLLLKAYNESLNIRPNNFSFMWYINQITNFIMDKKSDLSVDESVIDTIINYLTFNYIPKDKTDFPNIGKINKALMIKLIEKTKNLPDEIKWTKERVDAVLSLDEYKRLCVYDDNLYLWVCANHIDYNDLTPIDIRFKHIIDCLLIPTTYIFTSNFIMYKFFEKDVVYDRLKMVMNIVKEIYSFNEELFKIKNFEHFFTGKQIEEQYKIIVNPASYNKINIDEIDDIKNIDIEEMDTFGVYILTLCRKNYDNPTFSPIEILEVMKKANFVEKIKII